MMLELMIIRLQVLRSVLRSLFLPFTVTVNDAGDDDNDDDDDVEEEENRPAQARQPGYSFPVTPVRPSSQPQVPKPQLAMFSWNNVLKQQWCTLSVDQGEQIKDGKTRVPGTGHSEWSEGMKWRAANKRQQQQNTNVLKNVIFRLMRCVMQGSSCCCCCCCSVG